MKSDYWPAHPSFSSKRRKDGKGEGKDKEEGAWQQSNAVIQKNKKVLKVKREVYSHPFSEGAKPADRAADFLELLRFQERMVFTSWQPLASRPEDLHLSIPNSRQPLQTQLYLS